MIRRAAILTPMIGAELRPGEYVRGELGGVALACPCCGHVSALPPEHVVLPCGTVDRLWVCPSESCPSEALWLELLR